MKKLRPFQEFGGSDCDICGKKGLNYFSEGKVIKLCKKHFLIKERREKLDKIGKT